MQITCSWIYRAYEVNIDDWQSFKLYMAATNHAYPNSLCINSIFTVWFLALLEAEDMVKLSYSGVLSKVRHNLLKEPSQLNFRLMLWRGACTNFLFPWLYMTLEREQMRFVLYIWENQKTPPHTSGGYICDCTQWSSVNKFVCVCVCVCVCVYSTHELLAICFRFCIIAGIFYSLPALQAVINNTEVNFEDSFQFQTYFYCYLSSEIDVLWCIIWLQILVVEFFSKFVITIGL